MSARVLEKFGVIGFVNRVIYGGRRYCSSTNKYDLVVIGGGSGGLACSKEAAALGKRVAVLDYVTPSAAGTVWGLGGTCVNVGCIPKKLMHQAAIVGRHTKESSAYGWKNQSDSSICDWPVLVDNVMSHVKSLNWGHRVALMDNEVEYINARGSLIDKNTVRAVDKKGNEVIFSSDHIVIATGMRPKYMNEVPGMEGNAITSDDIFSLATPPGKTLVIGGSYVALECAGFLSGLGFDTSVMIRSIPLRGFDQEMAELVVTDMSRSGTRVIRGTQPTFVQKTRHSDLLVQWEGGSDNFNTVLIAIGRTAQVNGLGLENIGVETDNSTGCLVGGFGDDLERTSVNNVYAIGDVLYSRPQLTPVAIKAGKLLAQRLFNQSDAQMDYRSVATTVFTPMEYSSVGLSEKESTRLHGANNIEVYHAFYKPLEYSLPQTSYEQCYIKVICMRESPRKVLGIHLTGPNSGEIMQGFSVALRCGVTMDTLQTTAGIHPTIAEELVKVHITKRSGLDPTVTGC